MQSEQQRAIKVVVHRGTALIFLLLAGAAACSDGTGVTKLRVDSDSLPTIVGLMVSAPVAGPVTARQDHVSSDAASVASSVVYVSLAPSSVPTGQKATIRNVATGYSTIADLINGGFDPAAIPASAGDTLVIEVTRIAADVIRATTVVAKRRPPVVVRTDPPPKKRDVPLNAAIVMVFSTPIDETTLTTETVQLRRGATVVPGTLRFSDIEQVRLEFHPDGLLAGGTDYQLILSEGIRDANGVALESAVSVSFTTGTIAPATNLVFASVSVGYFHSCGVTVTGAAYCWGTNNGTLGDGTTTNSTTPVAVLGGLTFESVSAGAYHTCGVTTSGAAYCWGGNGHLGNGPDWSLTPVPVAGALTFASVSVGSHHTCGVTKAGAAYCWGAGYFGELGVGSPWPGAETPKAVVGGLTFSSVSAGGDHSCGVTTTGSVFCWGRNAFGELGVGASTALEQCEYGGSYSCSTAPVEVAGALSFASVSTGSYHTCGVTTTGSPYCWGNNLHGLLGNGTNPTGPEQCADVADLEYWADPVPCSRVPAVVAGGLDLASLTTGGLDWFACGLTPAGVAYCWGGDWGTVQGTYTPPLAVGGGLTFATLSAGYHSTCGVTKTGVAYCWGANSNGELGNGTTTYSSVPVKVAGQSGGDGSGDWDYSNSRRQTAPRSRGVRDER